MTLKVSFSFGICLSILTFGQYAWADGSFIDTLFERAETTPTDQKDCLDFATSFAPTPSQSINHYKMIFNGAVMRCANAKKSSTWPAVQKKIVEPYQGVEQIKLYADEQTRQIELADLPAYFSRRIITGDTTCLKNNFSKKPNFTSIEYKTVAKWGGNERAIISHSGFTELDDKIAFKEQVKFSQLPHLLAYDLTNQGGLLNVNAQAVDNDNRRWITQVNNQSGLFKTIKKPADRISFPVSLKGKFGDKTYSVPVNYQIRFEGCAAFTMNGTPIQTSVWAITDPVIKPGFIDDSRFEALAPRTKFIEYSSDLGWAVNYAYRDEKTHLMKFKSIAVSK